MEGDAVEVGRRLEDVGRTGDQQLLRRIDALVADDVALQCSSTLAQIPIENTGMSILSSCSKAARSFQNAS